VWLPAALAIVTFLSQSGTLMRACTLHVKAWADITQMVLLQQKDLDGDAQGRIALGLLECVETSECLDIALVIC